MFVIIAKYKKGIITVIKRISIAIIAVIIASAIRKLFLSDLLQNKIIWLTFYPIVAIASFFGGFFSGLLTSLLSCVVVVSFWNFISPEIIINSQADWIGLFIFVFNCAIIAALAEYSLFQKKQANKAKEMAELASKSKSVFLANMSHELRTPLNAILGFSRLMLSNSKVLEEDKKNLTIINRSGEHLLSLINDVLDISKIEAGRATVELVPCNLHNLLQEAINISLHRAETKGIVFESNFSDQLPIYIKTDEIKLKQILINILGNAVKFTKQGKVTLKVNYVAESNNKILQFEITDTGEGICANDLQKIFLPFIQSGNQFFNRGTGLGLAISKRFAELLNGDISVDSKLGIGSTFTLKIPFEFSTKDEISVKQNQFSFVKALAKGQRTFKILIVEDQQENWLLLQRILDNIGIDSRVAENGLIGVEVFKKWNPDLIFMDIRMPVMNGIEATKKIRSILNGKSVKIIGISAHVFNEEIEAIMSAGMDGFIKKPFEFYEIYECLDKHLKVKYTYDEKQTISDELNKVLTQEMVNELDNDILSEMRTLIINQEVEKIKELIKKIIVKNKITGDIILSYINNLRFSELFQIINQKLKQG